MQSKTVSSIPPVINLNHFWCFACKEWHTEELLKSYRKRPNHAQYMVGLLEWQQGHCPVCRELLCLLKSRSCATDHDHACCPEGGFCEKCARGVLCGLCNRMLGLAKDRTKILRRGATYLQTWRTRRYKVKKPLRVPRHFDVLLAKLYNEDLLQTCQSLGTCVGDCPTE